MDTKDINLKLYMLAEERWGTQRAMASHFELSPFSLNRMFAGKRHMEIYRFVNVCHELHIFPHDLLRGEFQRDWDADVEPMTNQKVARMMEKIRVERMRELTKEEKKKLAQKRLENPSMVASIQRCERAKNKLEDMDANALKAVKRNICMEDLFHFCDFYMLEPERFFEELLDA